VAYDGPELERWRGHARAAADLAAVAAAASPSWSCFLSEQAAQLALKGLLHAVGEQAAAWGDDLGPIERRTAAVFGADWPPELAEVALRLGRHYQPARYPDAHPGGGPDEHYSAGDARQAAADTAAMLAAVDAVTAALRAAEAGDGAGDGAGG